MPVSPAAPDSFAPKIEIEIHTGLPCLVWRDGKGDGIGMAVLPEEDAAMKMELLRKKAWETVNSRPGISLCAGSHPHDPSISVPDDISDESLIVEEWEEGDPRITGNAVTKLGDLRKGHVL